MEDFNPDYLIVPRLILKDGDIPPSGGAVYGAIYLYSQLKKKKCIASNEKLANIACVSKSTVSSMLPKLERKGYIKREYKTEKKKERKAIVPLVKFGKVEGDDPNRSTPHDPYRSSPMTHIGQPHDPYRSQNNINKKDNNKRDNKEEKKLEKKKEIFAYWKEKDNTITHRKFKQKMKGAINARFREGYAAEEIKEAIDNYDKALSKDNFWLDYRWTLDEFLQRGFEKCLDWDICKSNYRDSKKEETARF